MYSLIEMFKIALVVRKIRCEGHVEMKLAQGRVLMATERKHSLVGKRRVFGVFKGEPVKKTPPLVLVPFMTRQGLILTPIAVVVDFFL